MPDEVKLLPCEDKCAICGKLKMQHSMSSGFGMCQIYPTFVSERAMFERLSRAIEATRPTEQGLGSDGPRAWIDEQGTYRAPDGYHFTIIDAPGFDSNGYPRKSAILTPNCHSYAHD